VQELGGPGPSIDALYAEGNAYIESNPEWDTMGITSAVSLSCVEPLHHSTRSHSCGPCVSNTDDTVSLPYSGYSTVNKAWECPFSAHVDSCASDRSTV